MFTHLHTHTEYSMLDGISRIPDLVYQVRDMGMESLAITDHGNLYGAVDFYSECKEAGIKPIIGCEVYVAHDSRHDRNATERSPYHLVLLARDNTGYRNLMQLVTKGHLEGFHYRPRIDKYLLEQHREGLICLSGCASAEVPRLIADGNLDGARQEIMWYRTLFGDGYFLELQRHDHVPHLPAINEALTRFSRELNVPLVVTNDSHYVRQHEAPFQDLYICIQTNTTVQDEKRLRMEDDSYYVKSPAEMQQLFSDYPEALENTQLIADMCKVELGFGQTHLPKFPTPNDIPADEYLAQLCWEGFRRRYPRATPEAEERLKYELEVIRQTQFGNYFLVVWDICAFVHRNDIMFGVRGSAAASVALYCLGITDVDPLEYRLVFERFLNLERKEMPDIDMDFQDDRRDEVLNYVIERYGSDRVAQIITYGTMGAKSALRDVGRSLGMSYGDVDRIARMVPFKTRTLKDALRVNPELSNTYEADTAVRNLVDNAQGLEGIVHHVSTHAAGVLISEEPLTDTVPLQRPAKGDENSPVMMTQYSMDPVAKLGLLKMDFLGLTNLTILDRATRLLDKTRGIKIDLSRLSLDDKETFELLSSGKTTDLFQLESSGMQRYIKELQPSTLGDIAAMIALYRPGPMEHIDTFIDAKHGRAPITYPDPSLKELLDETYGVIVYQDQVLLILQQFAGYTLGEADKVRKAMGKKISSLMAEERVRFIDGSMSKGYERNLASQVFNLIEPFAGYAFNKAHSVCYALISYWTAYFKAHHPLEYMCSVLNSRLGHPEKMVSSINECSKLGIPVLLPDINHSEEFFTVDRESQAVPSIRFGLAAIKLLSEASVSPLVSERKANGPYENIDEFCRRADVSGLNRRSLDNLIKAGAFDSLGARGALLAALDVILSTAQRETRNRNEGQTSLFGGIGQTESSEMAGIPLTGLDVSSEEKAIWEKELLGVSLSYNPLMALAAADVGDAINSIDQLDEDMQGLTYALVGHVATVTERYTKDQKKFLVVGFDLLGGQVEVLVWPDVLERTAAMWSDGKLLRTTGKLRLRGDGYSLACDQVWPFEPASSSAGEEFSAPPPPVIKESKAPAPAPVQPANGHGANGGGGLESQQRRNGNGSSNGGYRHQANGSYRARGNGQGNGSATGRGNGYGNEVSNGVGKDGRATTTVSVANARTVFVGISESDDPVEDAHLLREVISLLLEYPGKDRVNLEIHTGGRRVILELPVVSTGYCEALQARLEELLGANSVMLQGADGPDLDNVPF